MKRASLNRMDLAAFVLVVITGLSLHLLPEMPLWAYVVIGGVLGASIQLTIHLLLKRSGNA